MTSASVRRVDSKFHAKAPQSHVKIDLKKQGLLNQILHVLKGKENFGVILVLIIVFEALFSWIIIKRVPYTEIDWVAYMQEVQGFLHGETNYELLKGNTGPLVYPAGFVYIFSALYYATDLGLNVLRAQYLFYALYLGMTVLTAIVLHRSNLVPNWAVLLIVTSKRIHSIFVLRCFNDPVAMLFLYLAVLCFLKDKWKMGSICFSLGVSVKMNVLLFAPGLLVLYLQRLGILGTIFNLLICLAVQVVLALPFLLTYPWQYIGKAFEFGRVFTYIWTVNLKFLPEDIFVGKVLAKILLAAHLLFLVVYFARRESVHPKGLFGAMKSALTSLHPKSKNLSPEWIVSGLFVSNFIGIVFARSLHYQFYVWYYHTLPVLISLTSFPLAVKLICLAGIEYAFNVFPSVPSSSLVLLISHFVLLWGVLTGPRLRDPILHQASSKSDKVIVRAD